MTSPTCVGIIGLGVIGAGIARALAGAGHVVVGMDLDPEAVGRLSGVARPLTSSAAVATESQLVIVAVHNDAQVRDVLGGDDGVFSVADPPQDVVVVSTVSLETITWAAGTAPPGVSIMDCGVTGGERLTKEGRLVAMIGGPGEAVARVTPVLSTFGDPIIHTGPLGSGMVAKLARNVVLYGSWLVGLEAASLARAGGVDVAQLAAVCDAADRGGMSRPLALATLAAESEGGPSRQRILGFVHKDLGAARALAAHLDVDMPTANLVEREVDGAFLKEWS